MTLPERCFVVQGDQVLALKTLFMDESVAREELRAALKRDLGVTWVWWEDEVGSAHDPIRGPHPVLGPKAKKKRH